MSAAPRGQLSFFKWFKLYCLSEREKEAPSCHFLLRTLFSFDENKMNTNPVLEVFIHRTWNNLLRHYLGMEESCSLSRIIPHPILHSWWSYGGRNCSLFPSRAVISHGSEETKIGCQRRRLMHLKDQNVRLTRQTNHKVQEKCASVIISEQKEDLVCVKSKNRSLWTEWSESGQCLSTG